MATSILAKGGWPGHPQCVLYCVNEEASSMCYGTTTFLLWRGTAFYRSFLWLESCLLNRAGDLRLRWIKVRSKNLIGPLLRSLLGILWQERNFRIFNNGGMTSADELALSVEKCYWRSFNSTLLLWALLLRYCFAIKIRRDRSSVLNSFYSNNTFAEALSSGPWVWCCELIDWLGSYIRCVELDVGLWDWSCALSLDGTDLVSSQDVVW